MASGILFYTDNRVDNKIATVVRDTIAESKLPIVSVSLKPLDFGSNITVPLEPSYQTMILQIITGLMTLQTDYVFFCENDVLYPKQHFMFIPFKDDVYYYNENVWRWDYPNDRFVAYDRLISLSGLCCNRQLVLNHYLARAEEMKKNGWDKVTTHEPDWARKWGYEPGTKKKKRGGFSDEDYETWKTTYPMIDIRHRKTFSRPKVKLTEFKHAPTGWRETTFNGIEGWRLKELFKGEISGTQHSHTL